MRQVCIGGGGGQFVAHFKVTWSSRPALLLLTVALHAQGIALIACCSCINCILLPCRVQVVYSRGFGGAIEGIIPINLNPKPPPLLPFPDLTLIPRKGLQLADFGGRGLKRD